MLWRHSEICLIQEHPAGALYLSLTTRYQLWLTSPNGRLTVGNPRLPTERLAAGYHRQDG